MENVPWICYSLSAVGQRIKHTGRRTVSIEDTLKRAELFLGLDDADLLRIATLPSSHEAEFAAGEVILRDGTRANHLFVLREGQVELVIDVPAEHWQGQRTVVIDLITTGGCFGWSALVRPHFYVMSAVCLEWAEVVVIDGAELMALFDDDYHIGYRVFQSLSHIVGARMRDVEQALARGQRLPFPGLGTIDE